MPSMVLDYGENKMAHLMSEQEIIEAVCALHCVEAVNQPMVYEVWEDGEVTLTKGGELYGQRGLHVDSCGDEGLALPWDSLPVKNSKHSRIWAATREDAYRARGLILGEDTGA
jgi:hypothetical protein